MVAPLTLDVYRTAIPMRRFEHSAAKRLKADGIVVKLTLSNGVVGWGETHPREYVTGETLDSVPADIGEFIWPRYCNDPAAPFPLERDGRAINAAACAVELAHLDATEGFPPGSAAGDIAGRVSGVLGSSAPARTIRQLRMMRCFGLRDFKLKLGLGEDVDRRNLAAVCERLGRAITAGKCSLRVDVNGGWDENTTPDRIAQLRANGVCAVEQPIFCQAEELVDLARRCELPLIADESLLTEADARRLQALGDRIWWNIRISKNGGFAPAKRLVEMAAGAGVPVVIGCMVGESGILSAAQRRLLVASPRARFIEGNYGTFLIKQDLARPSLRFGYAGRLKRLNGQSLGVVVDPNQINRYGKKCYTLKAGAASP